jgi:hypothetical protein
MNSLKTHEAPQTASSLEAECERLNALVYLDVFGAYRWEFRQADGHYVDSKESYETREDCVRAAFEVASTWMRLHRKSEILQTGAAVMPEQPQSASVDAREGQEDSASGSPDRARAGLA